MPAPSSSRAIGQPGRPRLPACSGGRSAAARRVERTAEIARRISGRLKNRSPRSWKGTPAARRAASKPTSWPFVRTRTAIWSAASPSPMSRAPRRDRPLLLVAARELADDRRGTVGPGGTSRLSGAAVGVTRPRASSRLASARTWGSSGSSSRGDDPRRRVAAREPGQPFGRGAGERVDRLVGVADDRQVVAPAEPGVEQRLLEGVGVLVFVDAEPAIPVADLPRDGLVVLDQPDRRARACPRSRSGRPAPWRAS